MPVPQQSEGKLLKKKWPAAFPAFALAAEASFGAQAAEAAPGLRTRSYFGGVGSA